MLGIEPFDLVDAGAGILGEVVNVDLAVGPNDRHANRRVPQTVDGAIGVGDRIVLEPCSLQDEIELALNDAGSCGAVWIAG